MTASEESRARAAAQRYADVAHDQRIAEARLRERRGLKAAAYALAIHKGGGMQVVGVSEEPLEDVFRRIDAGEWDHWIAVIPWVEDVIAEESSNVR